MHDLIPLKTDDRFPVNARDLHSFLNVARDFSTWIAYYRGNFVEGQDFTTSRGEKSFGRPTLEYMLSFDMSKHIALRTGGDKGHQIRQWFIDRENRLAAVEREGVQLPSYPEALRQLASQIENNAALNEHVRALTPKAEHYDRHMSARGSFTWAQAGKFLHVGVNKLPKMLLSRGILYRDSQGSLVPKQKYIDRGYFETKQSSFEYAAGKYRVHTQVTVTPKGADWISRGFVKEGLIPAALELA